MKKLIAKVVYSNIYIAMLAGTLTYSFGAFSNLKNTLAYASFIFFCTLFIYNLQRVLRLQTIENKESIRLIWFERNLKFIYTLIVISLISSLIIYLKWLLNLTTLWLIVCFTLISVFYALKNKFINRPLREVPYIKIHLIALSWLGVCCIWPLYNETESIDLMENWKLYLSIYLFFIAITIPFDIRDLPYDSKSQRTIPQIIGVENAKVLAILLLLTFPLLNIELINSLTSSLITGIIIIYSSVLLRFCSIDKYELYFSGWIDLSIGLLAVFFLII